MVRLGEIERQLRGVSQVAGDLPVSNDSERGLVGIRSSPGLVLLLKISPINDTAVLSSVVVALPRSLRWVVIFPKDPQDLAG